MQHAINAGCNHQSPRCASASDYWSFGDGPMGFVRNRFRLPRSRSSAFFARLWEIQWFTHSICLSKFEFDGNQWNSISIEGWTPVITISMVSDYSLDIPPELDKDNNFQIEPIFGNHSSAWNFLAGMRSNDGWATNRKPTIQWYTTRDTGCHHTTH